MLIWTESRFAQLSKNLVSILNNFWYDLWTKPFSRYFKFSITHLPTFFTLSEQQPRVRTQHLPVLYGGFRNYLFYCAIIKCIGIIQMLCSIWKLGNRHIFVSIIFVFKKILIPTNMVHGFYSFWISWQHSFFWSSSDVGVLSLLWQCSCRIFQMVLISNSEFHLQIQKGIPDVYTGLMP